MEWGGVDPLAVYNPVMEDEFYGDDKCHSEIKEIVNPKTNFSRA